MVCSLVIQKSAAILFGRLVLGSLSRGRFRRRRLSLFLQPTNIAAATLCIIERPRARLAGVVAAFTWANFRIWGEYFGSTTTLMDEGAPQSLSRRGKHRVLMNAHPCQLEPSLTDGPEGHPVVITIERLVEQHLDAVFRYAYRFTGNAADAEDITQQVFLLAQKHIDQLRDPLRAGAWLLSIVRNTFLKQKRRQRPASASAVDLNLDGFADHRTAREPGEASALQQALDQLDCHQKQVILMYYFEGLSYQQIADKVNVAIGTVMSRLSRGKSNLREIIAAQEPAGEKVP